MHEWPFMNGVDNLGDNFKKEGKTKCPSCNDGKLGYDFGVGKDTELTCSYCKGTGFITQDFKNKLIECKKCDGRGLLNHGPFSTHNKKCPKCMGQKYIIKKK
jgi:DnaJ-class molecular chaperone